MCRVTLLGVGQGQGPSLFPPLPRPRSRVFHDHTPHLHSAQERRKLGYFF